MFSMLRGPLMHQDQEAQDVAQPDQEQREEPTQGHQQWGKEDPQ